MNWLRCTRNSSVDRPPNAVEAYTSLKIMFIERRACIRVIYILGFYITVVVGLRRSALTMGGILVVCLAGASASTTVEANA